MLLFTCSDDEHVGSRLHAVKYYEKGEYFENGLYGERVYSYDENGRISKIVYTDFMFSDLVWLDIIPGVSEVQDFLYTENQITVNLNGGARKYHLKFQEGNLIRYVLEEKWMDKINSDTVSFDYSSGHLNGFMFNGTYFTFEFDDRGNITREVTDGSAAGQKFDNKPNPFEGIPSQFFSMDYGAEDGSLYLSSIVRFFSKNNILGQYTIYEYDHGKVLKIEQELPPALIVQKFEFRD